MLPLKGCTRDATSSDGEVLNEIKSTRSYELKEKELIFGAKPGGTLPDASAGSNSPSCRYSRGRLRKSEIASRHSA